MRKHLARWVDEVAAWTPDHGDGNIAVRALSSAGLEHLPYKQGVGGSNPSAPMWNRTESPLSLRTERGFFMPPASPDRYRSGGPAGHEPTLLASSQGYS